ncbi:MAG: dihydropteroate synthase [Bacteroidota bacterium]|nr:dihydropteroate synthase [Bacteroidota bacterium]
MSSKDTFFSKKRTLNLGGHLLEINTPLVMGILNITPDSFYENSRCCDEAEILKRCETILSEGGSIIDIGAYSSRPGADDVSEEEELNRLVPALKAIRREFPNALLSVDTFRAAVAQTVVEEFGIQIINDISAGELDEAMFETIARLNVPYILMHMKGNPQTMQDQTNYNHLVRDIISYLSVRIDLARKAGIHDIIIDPGFGFGKTTKQNYELLTRLDEFRIFELPILAGVSRKSMIYKTLDCAPQEALNGTIAVNTLALSKGADILRVHDVKAAIDVVKIVMASKNFYL